MKKISDLSTIVTKKLDADSLSVNTPEDVKTEEQKDIEKAVEDIGKSLARTPKESWLLDLEVNKISSSEAASVLDTLLSRGLYEETYRYGKLVFKLRTRTAADADRLIEMLQEFDPKTVLIMQHLISRINLASSLSTYGDNNFSFTQPTDSNRAVLDAEFNDRYQFISNLPQITFHALTQVLEKFDKKVALSSDIRGLENF